MPRLSHPLDLFIMERSIAMPLGQLRRRDRQMVEAESEGLLARALVGRIGTVGPNGMPYVTPMNFVYDPATRQVGLHCATSGHLLDNLSHSPLACFEVDEPGQVIAYGTTACDTSQVYSSVICFGKARVVSDEKEKETVLNLFVRKYVDQLMPDRHYDPDLTKSDPTVAIVLQVETMTGKRRAP
jgi:nitroimidazol reductase NimA-like FMN-containing flavoprotein (pyridoxamine 5'-phosphate oxidase superfamily)